MTIQWRPSPPRLGSSWSTSPASLARDLVGFWPLDEEKGTRYDRVGNMHFAKYDYDFGTGPGVAGNARALSFPGLSTVHIWALQNLALSYGQHPTTYSVWLFANGSNEWRPISKAENPTIGDETSIAVNKPSAGSFYFMVRTSGGFKTVYTTHPSGTWFHAFCWIDPHSSMSYVRINDGSVASLSWGAGITIDNFYRNNRVGLGHKAPADVLSPNGKMQDVAFWKRILTADEQLSIYNLGLRNQRWFHKAESPTFQRFWMFPPMIERILVAAPIAGATGTVYTFAPIGAHSGRPALPGSPAAGPSGTAHRPGSPIGGARSNL